jgi:hypothetical protein
VIRFADASFAAWIMIISSTKKSLAAWPWQAWTMNTSAPRIDSR